MPSDKPFKCRQCGWCCRNVTINVSHSDLTRWFHEGRWDILYHVSWINNYPHKGTGGFYIRETALNPKKPCPFLVEQDDGKTRCNIHSTKPVACDDAPKGYTKFPNCPSFAESKDWLAQFYSDVKNRQRDDFYRAHIQRHHLAKLLIEARRMS